MNREDSGEVERPDSEVKTPYRRLSAKEKLRILEEVDAYTEPGEIWRRAGRDPSRGPSQGSG